MPATDSGSQVHREDLSNALILLDVKTTPVTSRMKKGGPPEDDILGWSVEKMGERREGGIPENKDVDAFEGDSQKKLYNREERFWRTPRVTVKQEKQNKANVSAKYSKQVTKKTKEQKRDIEAEILSDQDAREDNGTVGDKFYGLGRVINDGTLAFTDARVAIPADFRTPSAQIYTGALADFTETNFADMLQSRRDNLGGSGNFTMFAGSALKRHISENFGNYRANKEGYTVVVRTMTTAIDKRKFMASTIDVYEGEFGVFDIELADFMPNPKRGYGVDMDALELRPVMMCDHTELPYQGGGRSGLIDSILSYEYGDPRGHFKVAPPQTDEELEAAA